MRNGTCRAICDGSHKETHGTAAFCLHGADPRKQVTGCNCTPGRKDEQSPYRSELGGVVGTLTTALAMCKEHKVTDGAMTLALDCESAIKVIAAETPPKAKDSHYNMISECRHLLTQMPIKVDFKWIEGHQDDRGKKLDWWARQNIRMDLGAKQYWARHRNRPRGPHRLQHERMAIYVRGEKLARFHKPEIHEWVIERKLQDYWHDKDSLTPQNFADTNWEASKQSDKDHSRGQRRFFAKHRTRFCGVAWMREIWEEWDHSTCPLCGNAEERFPM